MRNPSRILRLSWRLAILCCLLLSGVSPAQSFLFVSPNTRDHLSDEAAEDSLNSFEQSNFLAVARYLAEKLCPDPKVLSTEGIYAGNAENSSLVTGCKNSQAQYLGELLGRYAHQKWILIFDPSPTARRNERLFIVTFTTDHPAETVKQVRQNHLNAATVLFERQSVQVYVWVTDNSQDAAVHALADAEHGTIREIQGTGTLIGDDDRAAAQRVFDQRIHIYERAHHQSFSRMLWSRHLRDLTETQAPATPTR